MNAFVVNKDQIVKTGVFVALMLVVAFLLGYFVGENNASSNKVLVKPASEAIENSAIVGSVDQPESLNVPGDANKKSEKKIKVEKKKSSNKKVDSKKIQSKKNEQKKSVKKTSNKSTQNKKEEKNKSAKEKQKKEKSAEKNKSENVTKKDSADKTKTVDRKPSVDNNKSSTSVNEKYYSIQAGMFSNEVNANSFITKLTEKKYAAYMVSFESSSGDTKYNVRVGKFEKREGASELLEQFQSSFSTPAYVVITQ